MKILIKCNGTLEDIAALEKLQNHDCHVISPRKIPLNHITHHFDIPNEYFDVAVQLTKEALHVKCKCFCLERQPFRVTIRDKQKTSIVRPSFLNFLVTNQPQDPHTRVLMETHIYNTAIACAPTHPERQLNVLKPYYNNVDVYKHRFEQKIPTHKNTHLDTLHAVIAYLANGSYENNVFKGSRKRWAQHLSSYQISCLSLVTVAIALTSHSLPVYIHNCNI